jgi:Uma2 family endonuclease
MAELIPPAPAAVRMGMSLQDFIEATNDQTFELINGERKPKLPTNTRHNNCNHRLFKLLDHFVESRYLGLVRMEATFVLPEGDDSGWVTGSRTPDLIFINAERLAAYQEDHPDWQDTPYLIVPDLVVEVISPTDKADEINEKIEAYLEDGVKLVWIFYPKQRQAMIYSPDDEHPRLLKHDDLLDGEDIVPGFQVMLSSVFM